MTTQQEADTADTSCSRCGARAGTFARWIDRRTRRYARRGQV